MLVHRDIKRQTFTRRKERPSIQTAQERSLSHTNYTVGKTRSQIPGTHLVKEKSWNSDREK
jgi:hypothetical protein